MLSIYCQTHCYKKHILTWSESSYLQNHDPLFYSHQVDKSDLLKIPPPTADKQASHQSNSNCAAPTTQAQQSLSGWELILVTYLDFY